MLKKFNDMESNKKITIVITIAVLIIIAIILFSYFTSTDMYNRGRLFYYLLKAEHFR